MPASRARRDGGYGAFGAHAFGDFGRLHCLRARRAHLLFPMTMDNAAQRQRYARIMRQQAAIVGLARGAPEGSALRSVVSAAASRSEMSEKHLADALNRTAERIERVTDTLAEPRGGQNFS